MLVLRIEDSVNLPDCISQSALGAWRKVVKLGNVCNKGANGGGGRKVNGLRWVAVRGQDLEESQHKFLGPLILAQDIRTLCADAWSSLAVDPHP